MEVGKSEGHALRILKNISKWAPQIFAFYIVPKENFLCLHFFILLSSSKGNMKLGGVLVGLYCATYLLLEHLLIDFFNSGG